MLNLCVINGSPRRQSSNSNYLTNEFLSFFDKDINTTTYYVNDILKNNSLFDEIINYDNILIVSPLYADSFPSSMLEFLWTFGDFLHDKQDLNINLYGIVNSGFLEGQQNRIAIEILKNFALSNNLTWKVGLGMGSGEMLKEIKSVPWQKGPKRPVYEALIEIKDSIQDEKTPSSDILLATLKFPKLMFKIVANHGWKVQAKQKFHLKSKDLYRKIY